MRALEAEPAPIREIIEAAKGRDSNRVRELLRRDPGLVTARTAEGETPLLAAVYAGAREIAELLLAAGAEPDLFEAAALGDKRRIADLLGERPGDATSRSQDGWTPLHLAAFFGRRQAVEVLLALGADLHARSENAMQNTPLHAAVAGRHADVVQLLLAHGADVRALAAGWSPLHLAAGNGSREIVEVLLASGADPSAPGAGGKTPLALALERDHGEVADLLRATTAPE